MAYRGETEDTGLVVVALGNRVLGLDRRGGKRRWEAQIDLGLGTMLHGVRVVGGRALVLGGSHVIALDAVSGAELWRTKLAHGVLNLLVDDDVWFVGGMGELTALDEHGKILWHDGFGGMGVQGPAIATPRGAATNIGDVS